MPFVKTICYCNLKKKVSCRFKVLSKSLGLSTLGFKREKWEDRKKGKFCAQTYGAVPPFIALSGIIVIFISMVILLAVDCKCLLKCNLTPIVDSQPKTRLVD